MKKMLKNMKRILCLALCICMTLSMSGCNTDKTKEHVPYEYSEKNEISEAVETEAEACFRYLWELAQTDEESGAYGLVRDRYPNDRNKASTATTGFALAAIPYAIEKGWITQEEGFERADKTMDTLLSLENYSGFLFHFINMLNGNHSKGSEVSIIDTGILLCGAIVAGEYFGGTVYEKMQQFYDQIDWSFYLNPQTQMFYMGYNADTDEFSGAWDVYGEQLMLYVLSAGSSTHALDKTPYYTFKRLEGTYGDHTFVHSWFGSIFTYQFSHAFIDFRGKVDEKGMDWYQNSVEATLAQRDYAITNAIGSKTYSENSWGLTACDTIDGYDGLQGCPPSGNNSSHRSNGHVATAGAIGSMPFAPEYCTAALENYVTYEKLMGEYGLKDAYNLDKNWYAEDYVGIDKGISLLMIANYESDIIWDLFMQNENVQKGMDVLGFKDVEE